MLMIRKSTLILTNYIRPVNRNSFEFLCVFILFIQIQKQPPTTCIYIQFSWQISYKPNFGISFIPHPRQAGQLLSHKHIHLNGLFSALLINQEPLVCLYPTFRGKVIVLYAFNLWGKRNQALQMQILPKTISFPHLIILHPLTFTNVVDLSCIRNITHNEVVQSQGTIFPSFWSYILGI